MSSNKVAIVTGASSGMGEALAEALASRGWLVAMFDIQPNDTLAARLGDGATYHHCDVADYDSQARAFTEVWDKYGRIDALCANAGIVDKSSIYILNHRNSDEIPPKPNLLTTDIDWKGVVYGTQLALHFMRKNKVPGGSIVATGSVAAVVPHETYPEYDGAKAAVVNFVRASSRVLRIKENIRINCVLPGIVATKIIPPEMVAAVSPECLTPVSTIVRAYNKCLDDDSLAGEVLECSVEEILALPVPELRNGRFSKRAVTVWDPLFKLYHGEESGLPDAIP
ncbi:15-hydroxyprostaglandin dehydrogenase [Emericellopsis atlantica]|uniref:15-hydroxyprostaglandin dehydrogenase n=1 Tax=Emericellopsis atlantica TaxID=2614577 RepID=A0A9P8CTD3_9HYPO|nr:15-hydroxyprostaglandin dehydrogenase [Emericellopsis atlantica]KAG9259034.1 15-hydroxyprostaglandin dehydrogenase [Emericellopsis atlantica]